MGKGLFLALLFDALQGRHPKLVPFFVTTSFRFALLTRLAELLNTAFALLLNCAQAVGPANIGHEVAQ